MSKSKTPAKKSTKAKTNGAATNGSSNGHKAAARSAKQGGHVAAERYAKDPKSVVKRLAEKAHSAATQAANAFVRADAAGDKSPHTAKLKKAITLFESAEKALS